MQRSHLLALVLAVLLIIGGVLAWRQIDRLGAMVAKLDHQTAELGERVKTAEEARQTAEVRADRAEEDAEAALRKAAEATEREQVSAEQAQQAEIDRQTALEKEQQAAAERAAALARADKEAAARAAAEEKRAVLARREAELITELGAAQADARQAQAEKERLEQRMGRELNRLQRALQKIGDTRRQALDQATGLSMTLDSRQVEFDFDRAELRPQDREVLSRIAGVLSTFEDFSLQIVGHTDDVGSVEYNQDLSERRAQAVRDYLVEAGLDPAVLSTKGMGKSSLLIDGTDDEARQRNRRVELLIVFSEGAYEALAQSEGAANGE